MNFRGLAFLHLWRPPAVRPEVSLIADSPIAAAELWNAPFDRCSGTDEPLDSGSRCLLLSLGSQLQDSELPVFYWQVDNAARGPADVHSPLEIQLRAITVRIQTRTILVEQKNILMEGGRPRTALRLGAEDPFIVLGGYRDTRGPSGVVGRIDKSVRPHRVGSRHHGHVIGIRPANALSSRFRQRLQTSVRYVCSSQVLPTPHRFRTRRQLWAYSGLALETRSSGEYRYVQGPAATIQQAGGVARSQPESQHDFKSIFKGAATRVGSARGPFQDFDTGLLAKGMKPTMARLTLALKIATITLLVWKKGVCFDAQQLKRRL